MSEITRWLDILEETLDMDWEREKIARWKKFLDFEPNNPPLSTSLRNGGTDPGEWPIVLVNEAIADMEKMLLQQLKPVYISACHRDMQVPNIRCNYGTGILAVLFGTDIFWMDDELDTLPSAKPLTV